MNTATPPARPPGFAVDVALVPPARRNTLRTDIAGFLGRTRRGPLPAGAGAKPSSVRVQGQRAADALFGSIGGQMGGAVTPYALNGYFENDGRVAYVVRLGGPNCRTASALWDLCGQLAAPKTPGVTNCFAYARFSVCASSPGLWANGAQVTLSYSRQGVSGVPSIDVQTVAAAETTEVIRGVSPATFADQVNATSALIRVRPVAGSEQVPPTLPGSMTVSTTLTLGGGVDDPPTVETYLDAIRVLGDEPEVALIAMPDLYGDLPSTGDLNTDERLSVLAAAVALADRRKDRLVLVDVPPELSASKDIIDWAIDPVTHKCRIVEAAASTVYPDAGRSGAVYHPWLWVPDPLGTTPEDTRKLIPPSGHVAGVISRLDRQRGAHYTPANAPVLQAFDAATGFRSSDRAVLNAAGINLIRCFPNQGLLVWGGRTLGTEPGDVFVAHRRLLHRLVRAIHAVAEPLVFEVNGPELWLALVRAITSVLVQAYRAGALVGASPAEAFKVQCDGQTNPPDAIDSGRVLCLVGVAPAVPMEFILLRVALDTEGRVEVSQ